MMAATVANLTLVTTKLGVMGNVDRSVIYFSVLFHQGLIITISALTLKLFAFVGSLPAWLIDRPCFAEASFRPDS